MKIKGKIVGCNIQKKIFFLNNFFFLAFFFNMACSYTTSTFDATIFGPMIKTFTTFGF
jgi:hypothetical protein